MPLGNDLILNTLNFNKSLCHYCSTVNRHQQIPGHIQSQSLNPIGIFYIYFIEKHIKIMSIAFQFIVAIQLSNSWPR